MFDYKGELKNKTTSRFEKPHNSYPRSQDNFIRPPFPLLRRRIVSGRYPNAGYRPVNRPMFRPQFRMHRGISSNFRYRSPLNPPRGMVSANIERTEFPNVSPSNRNIQYSCSPVDVENPSFPTIPHNNRTILYSCPSSSCERPSFSNAPIINRNVPCSYPIASGQRPSFPNASINNRNVPCSYPPANVERSFPNVQLSRNIQYSCSPISDSAMNYGENQTTIESADVKNTQPNDGNTIDLWVESLDPIGRKYFYNARTRITTWEKPVNSRIIELDDIQRLKVNPNFEQTHISHLKNQGPFVRPLLPSAPYVNSFYPVPRNFMMPPGLFMVPPPSTMYPPPPQVFETPPSGGTQNALDVEFNATVSPPAITNTPVSDNVQFSDFTNSLVKKNVSFDSTKVVDNLIETNKNFLLKCTSEKIMDTKTSSESKISDWSISDYKPAACPIANVNNANHLSKQMDNSNLNNSKFEENNKNAIDGYQPSGISLSKNDETKKSEEQTDKSRPVSSTPVPGTSWCVVWTGDEKVFFYDFQRKTSVWERPDELLNRFDVDQLTEKPILLMHEKPEGTSGGSDASAKKLKKDDKKDVDDLKSKEVTEGSSNANNIIEKEAKLLPEKMSREQRIKSFNEMLADNNVSVSSTWEKELHKIVSDSRYQLLPSNARKQIFESYALQKKENEKVERQKELCRHKEKFRSLLEEAGVNSKTHFGDFVQRYRKDVRFRVIEKIKQKEIMFNQYVSEMAMKEKDDEKRKTQQKKDFMKLLSEQKILDKQTTWPKVEKMISSDRRYKAIESKSLKEKIFEEYIGTLNNNFSKEKAKRDTLCVPNGSEETKLDLSLHSKHREEDSELQKYKLAVCDFKALLNDLIKNPEASWYSARKTLKEDQRWEKSHILKSNELEELFNQHIIMLNLKKREQFWRLLDETLDITFKTSWLDIRDVVLKDSRCTKFSSSERKCEKEFKEYLRQKLITAKVDFNKLLKETKIITHKSKSLLKSSCHLKAIEEILSNDKRYLCLESMRNERKEMLLAYIDKLHANGPSPSSKATKSSSSRKS